MDEQKNKIAAYFGASNNHYWEWLDNGEVIGWNKDITICYADELLPILAEMSDQGWPPLGCILMILLACKEDGKHFTKIKSDIVIWQYYQLKEAAPIKKHVAPALRLLQIVSELSPAYRTGKKRALLLKSIFAGIPLPVNSQQAKYLLAFFYKDFLRNHQEVHTQLLAELATLAAAAERIESKEALESILRTGLEQVPAPAPVDLTVPEPDLITQLTSDRETAGIGHIAQRILATLHIPIPTHPDHDQSFGGISDISNKGSYDRLLLSELAQEDHMLMARIAHNEALYLKREALTTNPGKDKVILIDASLKMWGKPRAFAIASALACMQYDKQHTNVIAYTLKGNTAVPANLRDKKGVVAALSVLDNHLHSGEALESLLQKEKPGQADYYLITSEELMQQPAFVQAVVRQQAKLNCLITVNRNGQFRLYQYSKGRKKLCNAVILDLDELLFKSVAPKAKDSGPYTEKIPAILRKNPFPLRHPASRLKRHINNSWLVNEGVVCITTDQRILYWPNKSQGAIEVSPFIENGTYTVGSSDPNQISLLLSESDEISLFLYVFDIIEGDEASYPVSIPIADSKIIYLDKYFHIQTAGEYYAVSCTKNITGTPLNKETFNKHYLTNALTAQKTVNDVFRFVRKGYNTLTKIRSIYVDATDHLVIGNWQLKLDYHQQLRFSDDSIKVDHDKSGNIATHTFTHPLNTNLIFTQFECANGVIATADSRGFLYLQTDNDSLPEVCITMITDKQITGWASDNCCAGNEYFIHDATTPRMEDRDFYHQYLQPYIALLKCP